jgi:hypothetical protein
MKKDQFEIFTDLAKKVVNSSSILEKYQFFIDAIKRLGYENGSLSLIDQQHSVETKLFEENKICHLDFNAQYIEAVKNGIYLIKIQLIKFFAAGL